MKNDYFRDKNRKMLKLSPEFHVSDDWFCEIHFVTHGFLRVRIKLSMLDNTDNLRY